MWSSIQTAQTFSIPLICTKAVFLSYLLCIHWSNTFNILQEGSFCIHNLANWHKRPSFKLVLAFDMPFSLSLLISCFWLKVRDVRLFHSLTRGCRRVIHWPNVSIVVSQRIGRPEETGEWRVGGAAGTTTFTCYAPPPPWAKPQNNDISNIRCHWSQIPIYSTNEKVWNVRITKMWRTDMEEPVLLVKWRQ